jgi:hypothetical protein
LARCAAPPSALCTAIAFVRTRDQLKMGERALQQQEPLVFGPELRAVHGSSQSARLCGRFGMSRMVSRNALRSHARSGSEQPAPAKARTSSRHCFLGITRFSQLRAPASPRINISRTTAYRSVGTFHLRIAGSYVFNNRRTPSGASRAVSGSRLFWRVECVRPVTSFLHARTQRAELSQCADLGLRSWLELGRPSHRRACRAPPRARSSP